MNNPKVYHYEPPRREELRQRADEKGDSIEEIDQDEFEDDGSPENENPHHYNITM